MTGLGPLAYVELPGYPGTQIIVITPASRGAHRAGADHKDLSPWRCVGSAVSDAVAGWSVAAAFLHARPRAKDTWSLASRSSQTNPPPLTPAFSSTMGVQQRHFPAWCSIDTLCLRGLGHTSPSPEKELG